MNIVVDAGNSLFKLGIFENTSLRKKEVFHNAGDLRQFLESTTCENILVSSVATDAAQIASWSLSGRKFILQTSMPVPIQIEYATPNTLGVDRLAAACGAWSLYPGRSTLVIDIGTCINYEFVEAGGRYKGGAISPGIRMRFESMHRHTARLPIAEPLSSAPLTGDTTITCLQSGVINGILEEIRGIISRYERDYPGIGVILCGGDAHFFENNLKPSIFVAPELVLMGLNSILLHNVDL